MLEAAEKVEYFYEEPKNRFLGFLKEGKPWCISRERIWGTPLPMWTCEKCGNKRLVASKKELIEAAQEAIPADFELHKPWVDRVTIKCDKCGGTCIEKTSSWTLGITAALRLMPDSPMRKQEKYVPTAFLTEGIDQTRGWANSLLLEHGSSITGKAEAPYKAFLFQGLTQDSKGRKMSKSLGNVVQTNELLAKNSADLCRFYMTRKCSPVDFMSFDMQELNRRSYQVLSTLYHLSRFFMENATFDEFKPSKYSLDWAFKAGKLQSADIWMLSVLQDRIEDYTAKLERCEFNAALAVLDDFVIETLSRLYVPMIRKELWTDDPETVERRQTIYALLHHTLKTVTLLFNPITPYLAKRFIRKSIANLNQTCQKPSI